MLKKVVKKQKQGSEILSDAVLKELDVRYSKDLKRIQKRMDKLIKVIDKRLERIEEVSFLIEQALLVYAQKMDSIEDTFYTLYHNIKRNQFAFYKEPEKWWNDYLDLKQHYKALTEEDNQSTNVKDFLKGLS